MDGSQARREINVKIQKLVPEWECGRKFRLVEEKKHENGSVFNRDRWIMPRRLPPSSSPSGTSRKLMQCAISDGTVGRFPKAQVIASATGNETGSQELATTGLSPIAESTVHQTMLR